VTHRLAIQYERHWRGMSFSRIWGLNVILNQEKSKSRTLTMVTKPHFSLPLRIATDERSIWKRCIESRIYTLREWKWVTFQGHRDNRTYRWPKPFIHPFSSLPNTPNSFEGGVKNNENTKDRVFKGPNIGKWGGYRNCPRAVKLRKE
jgi:hypothetical protein